MKRVLAVIAATFGLAGIGGCTIETDGEDAVSHEFGANFFGAGGVLNVVDPIEGDGFMAGGNVSIASEVEGDLVVAGGDVSVGGSVGDDAYVAGGNVNVDAIIDGNAAIAGGDVEVGPATVIAGKTSLSGGRIDFDGTAKSTLQAAGGRVRINGTVEGDVKVVTEDLTIGPEARVTGTLFYHGPEAPGIPDSAVIAGGIKHTEADASRIWNDHAHAVRHTASVAAGIAWFVGSFIVAALFAVVFPGASRRSAEYIGREPLKAIGLGFVVLVCAPLFGVLLVVTIIGLPLALMLVPVYLLLLFLGWVTTALFLGQKGLAALRGTQSTTVGLTLLALLVALLALSLLKRIPLIGGWITFFALVAGIGGVVWQIWSRRDGMARAI
jgi:hypothetical protein